ncbi:MAG: galactofuranosyltransferase [Clostridia bacterium]|nr:galactofuranosyltransferase [Clostridia bacterium]
MKAYLLTELPQDIFNAGFKAKEDIRRVLLSDMVDLPVQESFRLDKLPAFAKLFRDLRRIPRGGRLFIQCPIYSFFNGKFLPILCRVLRRRQLRVTLILHDVESLRYPDRQDKLLPLEKELFALADTLIVHNACMKACLQQTHGVPADKMVELGIFDYLYDKRPAGALSEFARTVFVAGNLNPAKSGYIYRLGQVASSVTVNLYGNQFDAAAASASLHHQGAFPPDELPEHLTGNFGLVWDGDSVDSCTGQTGEYLRINNPHKTSLYLAAGFPVIIWKQAALASFIENNGLGLVVESLEELPALFDNLTQEDYSCMLKRVQELGSRLREGAYIRQAVDEVANR